MASLVDANSLLGSKSELSLFSVPPTQVAIDRQWNDVVSLSNSCTSSGPWEFRIPADVHMIDARHNYIQLLLKIVKTDGSSIAPAVAVAPAVQAPHELVGPINLLGKTFFKNLRISFNGREVSNSNGLYMYRAYLETLLNHGYDAKKSHLQSSMWFEDVISATSEITGNTGLQTRAKFFENSVAVECIGMLHADCFLVDRYLLPNLEIRVELQRNSDQFCLMTPVANANYKIEVESMKWVVRKVEITPSLNLAIESALLKMPAKYPIRRTYLSVLTVDKGRVSTPLNSILNGQLPRRVLICMVDTDSFQGVLTKSPFTFRHNNLREAKITAGGHNYPNTPLKANFKSNQYMELYNNLFEVLNIGEDKGNGITTAKFALDSFILAFDMSPDGDDGGHWALINQGVTSLTLEFDSPLEQSVTLVAYFEFDNLMIIDRNRLTTFDFTLA